MSGTQPYVEQVLMGTKSDGSPSEVVYPCKLLERPRRSVGLKSGDRLRVRVKKTTAESDTPSSTTWPPADWDLTRPIALRMRLWDGDDWDDDNTVVLGGYRLEQSLSAGEGVAPGVDAETHAAVLDGSGGSWAAHEWDLTLSTLPALWADGGGGLIRRRTFNPLKADGTIDDSFADAYKTNSELLAYAIADLGLTGSIPSEVVASLDAFPRRKALDWGNRPALHEIDALCASLGHECVLSLDGQTLHIYRLPRGGEPLDTPEWVSDNANPYELGTANALRCSTIVVTSGDTRCQVVTSRTMDDLEWVWFDSRTGTWLNDAETEDLYPTELQPGDSDAFRAGPPKDPKAKAVWEDRLFRAVRIADADDRREFGRFVALPVISHEAAANQVAKVSAIIEMISVQARGSQFVSSGNLDRLEGARTHAGHGVIELPPRIVGLQLLGGEGQGTHEDCIVLGDDDLKITFGCEVNTGVYGEQYYAKAFGVTAPEGEDTEVSVVALTGEFAAAAMVSPFSAKIHAGALLRVGTWPHGGSPTWTNTTALDAAALLYATARASAGMVQGGVIEVRGLHQRLPGLDWRWVTRIEWDPARMITYIVVAGHEMPQGEFDQVESEVRRSVAAGLGRFSAPGSAAAAQDVTLGFTPGAGSGAVLPGAQAAGQSPRGAELAAATTGVLAALGQAPTAVAIPRSPERWLARITGATAISGEDNRWEYEWQEVSLSNGRTVSDSGRTHATSGYGKAINLAELLNTDTGMQGNQADLAEIGALTIAPIASVVVEMSGPFGSAEAPYCVFNAPNGLGGECS